MWSTILGAILGKSWETSLIGFLGALATILYPIVVTGRMPRGPEWIVALIIAAGFRRAKDGDKTGTGSNLEPIRGPDSSPPSTPYQQRTSDFPLHGGGG